METLNDTNLFSAFEGEDSNLTSEEVEVFGEQGGSEDEFSLSSDEEEEEEEKHEEEESDGEDEEQGPSLGAAI